MPSFYGRIDWFLAYGNAEQSFFRGHRGLFDAITVPGTVATVFRQGTGGFVMSLNKDYIIDPRTSIFQSDFDRGRMGTRHARLAEMHGPQAATIMTQRALRESDLDHAFLAGMARSVVDFQREYADTSGEKLEEYLTLLGESPRQPSAPAFILPPYFRFDSVDGPWHRASVSMATTAARHDPSGSICPVICPSRGCLRDRAFDAIVDSYDQEGFRGFFLWVSGLDQYRSSPAELQAFGELVRQFAVTERPLVNLFGGYFAAMLSHVGLGGLSHGVGYGEARDAFYYRGGPPGLRYYVPLLHRFYPELDARRLLARLGTLGGPCECPACMRVAHSGDTAREQAARLDREGLLSHFLYARRAELDHIAQTSLEALIEELESTYDAVVGLQDAGVLRRSEHLRNWARALTPLAT